MREQYWNFQFYEGIAHSELIQKLSEYDYGCVLYTNNPIPPKGVAAGNIPNRSEFFTEGTFIYSMSNRYFDYIDAGLPVISTYPTKLCELLDQYGMRVNMNIDTLDLEYLITHKGELKNIVIKQRSELFINNNIMKMTCFIDELENNWELESST